MRLPASERLILGLLIRERSAYGLQLVGASRGRLTRGGIYVTLGRMEEKGLVRSKPGDGGRRVYQATALGARALMAAKLFAGELKIGAGS